MPSLDISVSITRITIVYIINNYYIELIILILYSCQSKIQNQRSDQSECSGTQLPGELRMCSFWAGGISSFSCPRIPPATQARKIRHVVKEGMPEHRNAGTPECRNTGMPEHLNAGTPECRNVIFTLKENFKKYFKFIRNFLFKIKAFQHE